MKEYCADILEKIYAVSTNLQDKTNTIVKIWVFLDRLSQKLEPIHEIQCHFRNKRYQYILQTRRNRLGTKMLIMTSVCLLCVRKVRSSRWEVIQKTL